MPKPDPDERFSLFPLDPEEGLKRLLEAGNGEEIEPDDGETTDS